MERRRRDRSREAMEALREAIDVRRRGEAATLSAICDLAVEYRLDAEQLAYTIDDALRERLVYPAGEGTPAVSEFLTVEIAALLKCSANSAACRIASALDLKYRHPRLWEAVQNLHLDVWVAEKAASLCQELHPLQADDMTGRWLILQQGMASGPALNLLKKMVIEADREAAARREEQARRERGFSFRELTDGVLFGSGRFDAIEGRYIDARIDEIARLIAPLYPGLNLDARRAKAVFLAMNPHRLIELQNQLANQPHLELTEPVPDPTHACRTCGDPTPGPGAGTPAATRQANTTPTGPDTAPAGAYASKVEVVVHIEADAMGDLADAARIEKAGWLTSHLTGQLLDNGLTAGELAVNILPVIDLPRLPACDGYQPTPRLRRAVTLAHPVEVFPFSNRASGLDLDHTTSYQPGRRGQTSLSNLAPLTRKVHRVKTRGAWVMDTKGPGHYRWTSPLGYVYEVTDQGSWLAYTPDLGPPPPQQEHAAYQALFTPRPTG